MKRILVFLTVVSLMGCASSEKKQTPPAANPPPPQATNAEASKVGFRLQDFRNETWDNGLQVIYIENHSLPSVSYGLLVKDGSSNDPMAKSGLARMMAEIMTRGSEKMNATQIADSLGQLGTEFDQDTSEDYVWFQLSGLSQHSQKLLNIFSEVILHPRFEQNEINREKALTLAAIKQRPDHPDQFAGQAFNAYLFGGHPYGRPEAGLAPDIKSMSRKDLIKAYTRSVRPNNAVLVVTGDVTSTLSDDLKKAFGNWQKRDIAEKVYPKIPEIAGVNIRLVDKKDLTQSHIVFGNLGIRRSDPDYLALRIANIILGGNFSSRLMEQVRIKLGLTYGISSSFDARLDRGPFEISTFTKNKSVGQTVEETLKVLKTYYDGGVTGGEVDSAKNFLMGAFPRAIETSERLGFNLAVLRLYGISDDYLKNFVSDVNRISAGDVNEAIKRHLDVNNLKVLVFSNAEEALPQLRDKGLVEQKSYSEIF